jgi:hypothetical protein
MPSCPVERHGKNGIKVFMVTANAFARKHPLHFGQRIPFVLGDMDAARPSGGLADDLKLFGLFFLGGLTFMTVYLA